MTLPTPTSERWKPLRAGLVDMFYYDAEEFHFHDGRLLLRGNNGTGKSKVLALTLPFLLDGELAPHRVEPDGDRQKRMEWNLLLGGRHPHPERIGYTWLEFGRAGRDGKAEFRTVGCGLKAVRDRGIARHWFFVTTQRVGHDFALMSSSRVPLTREKLRDALDGHGMLYERASDYRRAVDEALFGLGEHRYESLVNLLIQLRQPQLSKRPDERLLSKALTEALPPLGPDLISTVADAFRGLDEERDALRALEDAHGATKDFLGYYVRYAALASKRKAAGPRLAQSRYEHLNRDLAEAEQRYAAAESALGDAKARLEEAAAERSRLTARRDALQASPEMRHAERLKQIGEDAARRDSHATIRERDRDRLVAEVQRHERRAADAASKAGRAEEALAEASESARSAAERALCEPEHAAVTGDWTADLARARRDTEALAVRRDRAVTELRGLLVAVDRAEGRHAAARAEVDRLTAELQEAAERVGAAETAVQERAAGLIEDYVGYLTGVTELNIPDPDEILTLLDPWTVSADGPNPAVAAIDDAARAATAALAGRQAELTAGVRAGEEQAAALQAEIDRLVAGGHDAPPVPYTRAEGARTGRPGAPLWRVIDFADEVPADHRAGLEAALEAAGLLDAWVTPEGIIVDAHDTVLLAPGPVSGPACSTVLRPAVDRADPQAAALPDSAVQAVLDSIGLGRRPGAAGSSLGGPTAWIFVDGRWGNGVLTGCWHKDHADHIGEGAREAARRARIAVLRDELSGVRERVAALRDELAGLTVRQRTLADEHRAVPSDADLREAHVKLAAEHDRRRDLHGRQAAAIEAAEGLRLAAEAESARAAEFAGDVGLPVSPEELEAVANAVAGYRLALAGLWPAADALLTARDIAGEAAEELLGVRDRLGQAAREAAVAREQAETAATTYRTLMETVADAVEELHRHLAEVDRAMTARDAAERAARADEEAALGERGKADGRRETLRGEIEQATADRDRAVAEFRAFAATGLLRVALPELEIPDPREAWAATPAVLLARAVNAELEAVDDGDRPWERLQKQISEQQKNLQDAMSRHGHSVGLTVPEGVMVIDVVFQGHTRDIPGLVAALAAETEQRARLLSAREREILENHLLSEVAGTLQELIAAAEDEVREMNAELEARPTSTGMRLRLVWKTAGKAPDGLRRIRERLRQTVDAWSPGDRAEVGAFLQAQIAHEHRENPAIGWTEQLTRALDYRTWHEFTIQRLQDGQWRPATGPASGGERVLAASVPLFAAASAHYKSAGNPYAPRLVALDEAFAGVDDDSRAKCLGLLATFDMDVVMTSEREWGCYPQVPGLAIAQLSRRDGIDAVLVTPWRWDGHECRRAERPDPFPAPAEPTAPRAQESQPDLFSA